MLKAETRDWPSGPEADTLLYLCPRGHLEKEWNISQHGITLSELIQVPLILDVLVWVTREDPDYSDDREASLEVITPILSHYPPAAVKDIKPFSTVRPFTLTTNLRL